MQVCIQEQDRGVRGIWLIYLTWYAKTFSILEQIVGILLFFLAMLKAFEQYSCKQHY